MVFGAGQAAFSFDTADIIRLFRTGFPRLGLKREHLKLVANFHLDDADPGINLEDTGAITTP
jgi:hypothetical protein